MTTADHAGAPQVATSHQPIKDTPATPQTFPQSQEVPFHPARIPKKTFPGRQEDDSPEASKSIWGNKFPSDQPSRKTNKVSSGESALLVPRPPWFPLRCFAEALRGPAPPPPATRGNSRTAKQKRQRWLLSPASESLIPFFAQTVNAAKLFRSHVG